MIIYLSRQISEIREEGWKAVRRKARSAFGRAVKLPFHLIVFSLAVPVVLFLRLIRPWVLFRFGCINSEIIGACVYDSEYYLTEREVEKEKAIDCLYFQSKYHPNEQWARMVRRHLRINPVFRYLDTANQVIPGGEIHHKVVCVTRSRDIKGYLARTDPHIIFNSEEDTRGRQFLNKLGLVPSDRFVCLIVRDSAYKEKFQTTGTPFGKNKDWSYHNYRDSDIDTYEDAAMALAEKGYWVIRMGKVVHKPLKADHTCIIDYANTKFRSDFLDIWLMANCFFCISGSCTGLDEVPRIFRRPAVYVNFLPLQLLVTYDHVMSVPKHLVWQETNKQLTLSEYLNHSYHYSKQYEDAKISVKDLTAEEICQAVMEQEAKLTGKWHRSDADQQYQDRFWKIFKSHPDFGKNNGKIHSQARIGTHSNHPVPFLR